MKLSNIYFAFLFAILLALSFASNVSAEEVFAFNATFEDATNAIQESKLIIAEMQSNNFSIGYVSDLLIDAERTIQQANYAEILRTSSDNLKRSEALSALKLIDWKNITYDSVLVYTSQIKDWNLRAFEIYDSLSITESKIEEYSLQGVDDLEARNLLNQAKNAFYQDRFDEAINLNEQARDNIETKFVERSSLLGIAIGTKNFFVRYWWQSIIVIIILVFVLYFVYRAIYKRKLKNKIRKLKLEQKAIIELTKKAQMERFENATLSEHVYKIRMNTYQEKNNSIKSQLPVLEAKLKKYKF